MARALTGVLGGPQTVIKISVDSLAAAKPTEKLPW